MPDIFDEILPDTKGDIFDQIAPSIEDARIEQSRAEAGVRPGRIALETAKGTIGTIGRSGGKLVGEVASAIRHPGQTVRGLADLAAGGVQKLIPGEQAQEPAFNNLINLYKQRYGGVDNIADTVANDPFAFLSDVGMVYGGAKVAANPSGAAQAVKNTATKAVSSAQAVSKNIVKLADDLRKSPKDIITKTRDYSANKVTAIRKGFWETYAPEEYKAFGDAIENLPTQGKGVIKDGAGAIQNIEKAMLDRGLIAPDGTPLKAFTPADAKLIKAYQSISKKWADNPNGELNIAGVVNEYKAIKGKPSAKPSSASRGNTQAANDFFNAFADQIDMKSFSDAKARYRTFKENQQLIDEAIGLYDPAMKTAKGERFLTEGAISRTTQGRKTAKLITEKTGQRLRGARLTTGINQLNPISWIKR